MLSEHSAKTTDLLQRTQAFFDANIYPNELRHAQEMDAFRRGGNAWQTPALVEELKAKARKQGLWNMFLPHAYKGNGGISNLDYAPLCEVMGRVIWSSEVFNGSAPRHRQHGDLRALRHRCAKRRSGSSRCSRARSARRS